MSKFDGKLNFEVTLIPYTGDDSWVEPTILEMEKCLNSEQIPETGEECEYCVYRKKAGRYE